MFSVSEHPVEVAFKTVVRGALSGKTLGRILGNETIRVHCADLSGRVLDVAGGAFPSHLSLLPSAIDLVRSDYAAAPGVLAVDMNEPLPFPDASFDCVLSFSALNIVEDPVALSKEIHRILKPGGTWYTGAAFIISEIPEPHDYRRFTAEGLVRLFETANFKDIRVDRIGERASAAVNLLSPFFLFNSVRALVYPFALFLDRFVPDRVRREHPTPVLYFGRCSR